MKWIGRALRAILLAVMLLLCAGVFYLIAIMGDSADRDAAAVYPSLAPHAAMEDGTLAFSADDLAAAQAYSGAPLMTISGGWYATGGEVRQWQERGETMREVRIFYTQNNTTTQIAVSTVTPREYLYTLPDRGLLPAAAQDYRMLNQQAACMGEGDLLHVHAVRGDAVYQIEGTVSAETLRTAAGLAIIEE